VLTGHQTAGHQEVLDRAGTSGSSGSADHQVYNGANGTSGSAEVQDQVKHQDQWKCWIIRSNRCQGSSGTGGTSEVLDWRNIDLAEVQDQD
jgi:hypothetical protein